MMEIADLRKEVAGKNNRFSLGSIHVSSWQEERRGREALESQGETMKAHQHLIWPVCENLDIRDRVQETFDEEENVDGSGEKPS